ncbi:hypothetical protein [Pelagibacterium sp.]|uniref:hypothetical protein n=1 Tax=Pelagibacterium sp. TaxID=1967288 RepID=UPI003A8FA367
MAKYSARYALQDWTAARGGNPIMAGMSGVGGKEHHLLGVTFDQHMLNADSNEGPDRPDAHFDLVEWDAWYADFKAQDLVVVVDDDLEDDSSANDRFMSRGEAGQ